eukprot:3892730-Amphidinium_carterae.1
MLAFLWLAFSSALLTKSALQDSAEKLNTSMCSLVQDQDCSHKTLFKYHCETQQMRDYNLL